MKFGKIFRQTVDTRMPHWREHVVNYKALKVAIKKQVAQGTHGARFYRRSVFAPVRPRRRRRALPNARTKSRPNPSCGIGSLIPGKMPHLQAPSRRTWRQRSRRYSMATLR